MTSKVEEALGDLYRYIAHDYQNEEDYVEDETLEQFLHVVMEAVKETARSEGVAEGMDKLGEKCADAFNEGVHDTVEDLSLVQDAEAFARGLVKGKEQMRAEIRKAGELIKADESMSGKEGEWASLDESRGEIDGMSARVDLFIVPASVLAGTEGNK